MLKEFENKVAELDRKAEAFIKAHADNIAKLAALKADYTAAAVSGKSTEEMEKTIVALEGKIERDTPVVAEYKKILGNGTQTIPSREKISAYKMNQELVELATAAILESEEVAEIQIKTHEMLANELAEIKIAFLKKVEEMGQLAKLNRRLSLRAWEAARYTDSPNKVRRIEQHVRPQRAEGYIYITPKESDLAYTKGIDEALKWNKIRSFAGNDIVEAQKNHERKEI
jgi:hypothetical protein